MTFFLSTVWLMIVREWHRLKMEPSRIGGMAVQPLLFLIVFGVGFNKSFFWDQASVSYMEFLFPGILGLVVLFASIYATLTLVDDKKSGFFKLVLISPGGIRAAVVGKVLATASVGLVQSILFLALSYFIGSHVSLASILWMILFLALGSLTFASIGVLFALFSPSSSAFHALMSIILIPMWLLSGAMFPIDTHTLKLLSLVNPMTYLVSGLRNSLVGFEEYLYGDFLLLSLFATFIAFVLAMSTKRKLVE